MTQFASPRHYFADLLSTEATATVPRISTAKLLAQPQNQDLCDIVTAEPVGTKLFAGKRVAVVSTDGVEEIELTATLNYFRQNGAKVDLLSPPSPTYPDLYGMQYPLIRQSHILTIRYIEVGGWVPFDGLVGDANAADYDAVVIPGGAWNPDVLRADPPTLSFVSAVAAQGGVVASLCHGPWVLADADLLNGRRATAWHSMRRDLERCGAIFVDQPVVVDRKIITARGPIDLAAFLFAIGENLLASS